MDDPRPTHVGLAASFGESGVRDVLRELDDTLIGLEPVKSRIRETAALLLVDKARRQLGLAVETPTLHMSFTGNPGTGTTTVALKMADLLQRLGDVRKGHLVTVTGDNLVVILAGYGDRMDRFFAPNPGFRSRIAHHIEFPDYGDPDCCTSRKRCWPSRTLAWTTVRGPRWNGISAPAAASRVFRGGLDVDRLDAPGAKRQAAAE